MSARMCHIINIFTFAIIKKGVLTALLQLIKPVTPQGTSLKLVAANVLGKCMPKKHQIL